MIRKYVNLWEKRYPEHKYGFGVPSVAHLTPRRLVLARQHGGGSVTAGLARMFIECYRPAYLYQAGWRMSGSRVRCPWCQRIQYPEDTFDCAHYRTPANPLGIYGCEECAVLDLGEEPELTPDELASAEDVSEQPPPRKSHAWRLRIPKQCVRDIEAIHPRHPRAWGVIVDTWAELQHPPPRFRRLEPAAWPPTAAQEHITAVSEGRVSVAPPEAPPAPVAAAPPDSWVD